MCITLYVLLMFHFHYFHFFPTMLNNVNLYVVILNFLLLCIFFDRKNKYKQRQKLDVFKENEHDMQISLQPSFTVRWGQEKLLTSVF